jgi:hypothetical protein
MGEIQVASTTDDQQEVNRVAGAAPPEDTVIKEEPDIQADSEPQPEKPTKPTPDDKMQKRIDRLTAQKSEAERRADQLAKELADERAKHSSQTVETDQGVSAGDQVDISQELRKRPKLGETVNPKTGKPHETQEEYEDDLMDWRDEKNALEYAKSETERKQKTVLQTYNERVEAFKAEHEDWLDVVGQNIDIPTGVQMAILEMDNGPEVAYFLGTHPQICKDLNNMSVARAVAEIGKVSARLEGPQEEKQKTQERGPGNGPDRQPVTSRAPAPIKPLTGHATRSSVPLDQMDYSEYRRVRDQQEKSRFRR